MKNDASDIVKRCLNDGCCICHSTVMMKRSVLEKYGGYNENFSICEDFELWVRSLVNHLKIEILEEKLIMRRLHVDSVTNELEGKKEPIENVISIKLYYLENMGYLKGKEITIWGDNNRNKIAFECIKKKFNNRFNIHVVDVYDILPKKSDSDYNFVTTFSAREKVFAHLNEMGNEILSKYIYL